MDRHTPFFRRLPDRQIDHLRSRIVRGKQFPFSDSFADILRVAEQRAEVMPVRAPGLADLRIFIKYKKHK